MVDGGASCQILLTLFGGMLRVAVSWKNMWSITSDVGVVFILGSHLQLE
jgi:hypothetical protein